MGRIKRFFKSFEGNWKKQTLFFLICMLFLICVYSICMNQINKTPIIVKDDFSWVYQIDSIEKTGEELQISGWAFSIGQVAEEEKFEILLCDTKTKKLFYPEMQYESRSDVNAYFLCEYDYTESGFKAYIPLEKLDLENTVYQVLLKKKEDRDTIETNVFYTNDEILYIHPDEYVALDVEGTILEKVVEEGVIRVHRPECGMYVYQYQGELYWIATPEYGFVEGDSVVQFQMGTTQISNLPQERLENNWFFGNESFNFCDNELREENFGIYRVAKKKLPEEYSLVYIWTGNYRDDWLWKQEFRPWYEFN